MGPLILDRATGDAENGGTFVVGHSAEEAHFHQASLIAVVFGEAVEGFVEGEEVGGAVVEGGDGVFEDLQRASASALLGLRGPGVVNQDVAHGEGGGGHEVSAILELAGVGVCSK